jgi:hypothetical protein
MESTALVRAASAETNCDEPALSLAECVQAQRVDVEQSPQHIGYRHGLCFRVQINRNHLVISVIAPFSSVRTFSATTYTVLLLFVLACVCIALPIWGVLPSVVGGVTLVTLWTVRAVVSLVAG